MISVHWQHELAQSLLLPCLWIQVKLQLYVTSVQLRQYSCMWAEEICRGRHASHLRLTRKAIENTRGHFGASSCAHTQSASWWPCWWELNSFFMYYRVLKWWRHKNEISEIMGFVRIFWKNNVQEAYLPKMSISEQIVSEIVAQLYSETPYKPF